MLALLLAGRRLVDGASLIRVVDLIATKALSSHPTRSTPDLVTPSEQHDTTNTAFGATQLAGEDGASYVVGRDSRLAEDAAKDDASRVKLRRKWVERRARAVAVRTRITKMRARDAAFDDTHTQQEQEKGVFGAEEELERRAKEIVRILREGESDRETNAPAKTAENTKELSKDKQSVNVNRYRKIVYSEGELDASDLSLPPSRTNPHPFDPSLCPSLLPPTHSRSLAQYVNYLPVLQNLVDLGVDLLEVDTNNAQLGRHLLRLEWERDVRPKLEWLLGLGVPLSAVGPYLTRNPFFLIIDLSSIKVRVNYLQSKKFTKKQIVKIITEFRYWLNTDVRTIDSRLGWIQKAFGLSGDEVRSLVVKEPRVIMFGLAPFQRLRNILTKELEFTEEETKHMLMEDPRLFLMDASHVTVTYAYLHYSMGLSNGQIAGYPCSLRCSVGAIRRRHEYLVRLGRDNYAQGVDTVTLPALLHPSDTHFAVHVARTFLAAYNRFLKTY